MSYRYRLGRILSALTLVTLSSASHGIDVMWVNPDGGSFISGSNWSTGNMPGTASTAIFDINSLYTVDFLGNVSTARMVVLNDKVTLDLSDFDYTLVGSGTELLVGGDPALGVSARLTILTGSLVSEQAHIAPDPGSVGLVELADSAYWNVPGAFGQLVIGDEGDGTVEIIEGADLNVGNLIILGAGTGSHGTLSVSGTGSVVTINSSGSYLRVGSSGSGDLFLTNGAVFYMPAQAVEIGLSSGTASSALISGVGTLWEAQLVTVGDHGSAALDILDGANVISAAGQLTAAAGVGGSAFVTVSGPGSLLDAGSNFRLAGEGDVIVEDSGRLTAVSSVIIGPRAGTIGTLTVRGATSWVTSNTFSVGGDGQGFMDIEDGAAVIQTNDGSASNGALVTITGTASRWTMRDLTVGGSPSDGSVTLIDGGRLVSRDADIFGGPQSVVVVTGAGSKWTMTRNLALEGTVTVEASGTAVCQRAFIPEGSGNGTLDITGVGSEFKVTQNLELGLADPGSISILDDGVLLVTGAYTQGSQGSLTVELTPSFVVGIQQFGAANLNGALEVTLADGFDPPTGTTFDILVAGSVSGQFGTEILPTTPSNAPLAIAYLADRVQIEVGFIPGDIDGDGVVGIADFLMLLGEWGPCADCGNCSADVNGDCSVGITDLLIVLENWS